MPKFTEFPEAKKLAYATKPGRIITFKQVQANGRSKQIAVQKFVPQLIQLVGVFGNDSLFYQTTQQLLDAIDWDWMEQNIID